VERVIDALNKQKKSLNGAKILILGVAYKRDVDDMRESPALTIINILKDKGAEVIYNDPYIPKLTPTRRYNFNMESVELSEELLSSIDAAIIVTDHSVYNYSWIVEHSPLIIDTRNATKDVKNGREKIVRA